MQTIMMWSVLTGLLAGAFVLVFRGLFGKFVQAITEFLFSVTITFAATFVAIFTLQPSFAFVFDGGYIVCSLTAVIVSLVVMALGSIFTADGGKIPVFATFVSAVALILVFIVTPIFVVELHPFRFPAINNAAYDKLADVIELSDVTEQQRIASESANQLMILTEASATFKAGASMPPNVGSYAAINLSYEQVVNGERVFITDLKVSNDYGFREAGGLPGYFISSATDLLAQPRFVETYVPMKYVPDAWWFEDLQFNVYLNYLIDCFCIIDDLSSLEVDDAGVPWYTATSWKYVVGQTGIVPFEVITINPFDGTVQPYPLGSIPTWIDRVYSIEKAELLVQWWASYSSWDAAPNWFVNDTSDQMKVDAADDAYGPNGELYYMFTITSAGSDNTLMYEIQFNPKTGHATLFKAVGPTRQTIASVIFNASITYFGNQNGAAPVECELRQLLGEPTWYCILEERGGSLTTGMIKGYAFLQADSYSDSGNVVIGNTLSEAWRALVNQIDNAEFTAAVNTGQASSVALNGVVIAKGDQVVYDAILLLVANETYPQGLYVSVPLAHRQITLTTVGHTVEVTGLQLEVNGINRASSFINTSLPPLND